VAFTVLEVMALKNYLLVVAVLSGAVAGVASAQSIESDLPPGAEPHTESRASSCPTVA
jgi:hypothetical protein